MLLEEGVKVYVDVAELRTIGDPVERRCNGRLVQGAMPVRDGDLLPTLH